MHARRGAQLLVAVVLSLPAASPVLAQQSALGAFTAQTDVGRVSRPGSVSYDPRTQSYEIAGSGQNMWADRDDFHFVWKRMAGDFILTARGHLLGKGVEAHRKLGWEVRTWLTANAPHATAAVHGDGLVALQYRRTAGGQTEEVRSGVTSPDVIQLERRGSTYILSVARFGDTLSAVQVTDLQLGDSVYVGLFVCAHNDTVTERASFDDVRITVPTDSSFVPYRTFLGSNLEVLDVFGETAGHREIVHSDPGSLQAPNWTRDGSALIYNQAGRMVRFDLATRTPTPLNTGTVTGNNNDHVLSFDGRMLGLSNNGPEEGGQSIVWTVPAGGGTPTRVTRLGPSYLHGWSPDGKFLVYTAQRDGEFDIYRIPVKGGEETRLTTAKGLDDGPEYSPDGQWIYFNSVRSGTMQLWRMRPDGSGAEQLTNDGFNNWFPHVSPDGRWVAFLSFPPSVPPGDHPWYKHVTIRLMPAAGGAARVIAYVYGGPGTINVPSWSPDSRRLAFVSNTKM